jgi:ABC-type glycerol-3-phosphate transport system substrate-binding protein
MQGLFLQGKAAITPNGDWIEGEMKYNYPNANIKMAKTPVISALADKCSFAGQADAEQKLRALIDYVDTHTSGYESMPTGVTEEDVDTVREAREVELAGAGPEHIALIPCYSNQKEAAKDFLLYMASDEGMSIYRESTGGCELPFTQTTPTQTTYSSFRQSVREIIQTSTLRVVSTKDKIYSIGGINVYLYNNKYGRFVTRFSADSANDYVAPLDYYAAEVAAVKKELPNAKKRIGL